MFELFYTIVKASYQFDLLFYNKSKLRKTYSLTKNKIMAKLKQVTKLFVTFKITKIEMEQYD